VIFGEGVMATTRVNEVRDLLLRKLLGKNVRRGDGAEGVGSYI
jgi:hypothetical protein